MSADAKPKRPPPPALSYMLRTARIRTEYKGAHADGLRYIFVALPDAVARVAAIADLTAVHERMCEREAQS